MRLSRLTDYAVTLLTQIVRGGKDLWSAAELAEKAGLPVPSTAKIMKLLAKSHIIIAYRGVNGGYRLARPASDISIASVIEAVEGPIALTDCAEGGDQSCRIEALCPMSGNWDKVNNAVRTALDTVSLAEMAVPRKYAQEVLQALESKSGAQ